MLPNNWQHDDANATAFNVTNGRAEALAANDAQVVYAQTGHSSINDLGDALKAKTDFENIGTSVIGFSSDKKPVPSHPYPNSVPVILSTLRVQRSLKTWRISWLASMLSIVPVWRLTGAKSRMSAVLLLSPQR